MQLLNPPGVHNQTVDVILSTLPPDTPPRARCPPAPCSECHGSVILPTLPPDTTPRGRCPPAPCPECLLSKSDFVFIVIINIAE